MKREILRLKFDSKTIKEERVSVKLSTLTQQLMNCEILREKWVQNQ
jgi:hypothetical protein